MIKKFSWVLVLFMFNEIQAQNLNHYGFFPTIDHSGVFLNKWSYSLYYFGAFNAASDRVNHVANNPGYFLFYAEQAISYELNKKLTFTGSYVYQKQEPLNSEETVNENRFYLQALYKVPLGKGLFKNRMRYDGRFIEDNVTRRWPYTSRIRYRLEYTCPFRGNKYYFSAYNEFFFNTYKKPVTIYAENWAYAGFGMHVSPTSAWELGPLYIFWVADQSRNLLNFYFIQLTWITHFDFRKNKE